jgi:hypothetical protein
MMSKPQKTGSTPGRLRRKNERHHRQRKVCQKHWRQKQELKRLRLRRAAAEPQPTPTARGYVAQRFWEALHLDEALTRVGLTKAGGLAIGCILLVVLLFGVMNVTSLTALAAAVGRDTALCAVLGITTLEHKMLYRTLAAISVPQYQAWVTEIVRALQQDPRTASQPHGIVAGDETQVDKRYGGQMAGIRTIFLHSTKVFTQGYDIASTHYADWDKDYPLFCGIYQPDEAKQAELDAAQRRKKLKIDRRKTADFIRWLQSEVTAGHTPQVVELTGHHLNRQLRHQLEQELQLPWVGVSGPRRVYTLAGARKSRKAKTLVQRPRDRQWIELTDLGCRLAVLGPATCSLGPVLLVVVEQVADAVRGLYVLPPQEQVQAVERLTLVLQRAQDGPPAGKLHLMLELLGLSQTAGIRAETAVFDRWYLVPWFIQEVLAQGFKRVVVPAKQSFHYQYRGHDYELPALWDLWPSQDFADVTCRGQPYRLLARPVQVNGLGPVQLVFVAVLDRHGTVVRRVALLCTDRRWAPLDVLKAYKLRWKIEVCYRECKQHHGFGQFHARTFETIYGQLVLSLLAYICVSLTRLLTKSLQDKTLGWVKKHYFNSLVNLTILETGETVIELSGYLWDHYGLPDFTYPSPG